MVVDFDFWAIWQMKVQVRSALQQNVMRNRTFENSMANKIYSRWKETKRVEVRGGCQDR